MNPRSPTRKTSALPIWLWCRSARRKDCRKNGSKKGKKEERKDGWKEVRIEANKETSKETRKETNQEARKREWSATFRKGGQFVKTTCYHSNPLQAVTSCALRFLLHCAWQGSLGIMGEWPRDLIHRHAQRDGLPDGGRVYAG